MIQPRYPISPAHRAFIVASPSYEGDCQFCGKPVLLPDLGFRDSDGSVWHRCCQAIDTTRPNLILWQISDGPDSYLITLDTTDATVTIRQSNISGRPAVILPARLAQSFQSIFFDVEMAQRKADQDAMTDDEEDS